MSRSTQPVVQRESSDFKAGYEGYADAKGWPVGKMYRDDISILKIFAFLAGIGAPIVALFMLPWWMAIVVVVGGFFTGLLGVRTLKSRSQIVAPIGLVACWVVGILIFLAAVGAE